MSWTQTEYPFAPGTQVLPGQEQVLQGSVVGALVDGSTVNVTYANGFFFPVSTDNVIISVTALSDSNVLLGKETILSMSTTGFSFVIPGGNVGDTATINWTAYGH